MRKYLQLEEDQEPALETDRIRKDELKKSIDRAGQQSQPDLAKPYLPLISFGKDGRMKPGAQRRRPSEKQNSLLQRHKMKDKSLLYQLNQPHKKAGHSSKRESHEVVDARSSVLTTEADAAVATPAMFSDSLLESR